MRWYDEEEYRALQRENSILEAMVKGLQEEVEALRTVIDTYEAEHKKGKGKK